MSETMRLAVAGIAWIAFWFGIPAVLAYWELHIRDGISVVTGEPLPH